jgi:glycine C-acetyltransferase
MLNGTVGEAAALAYDLRENFGIFCSVVIYPVVPKDTIFLRLIPTGSHSLEDVDRTIKAFEAIKDKLKVGHYRENELAKAFKE